jgi:uncharacterized integral membrane protein
MILVLATALLLVIFGVQNTQLVNVSFLTFRTGYISLSLVIMGSALVGALMIGLLGMWGSVRQSFHERAASQRHAEQVAELEARVAELAEENAALRLGATPPPRERAVGGVLERIGPPEGTGPKFVD